MLPGLQCKRASSARTSWSHCWCPHLCAQAPVVVEAQFREHFQLAHATPQYAALLAAAPAELVASSERLAGLVALLSAAVEKAFAEQALPLPPWRRRKSVLSKWGLDERALPGARAAEALCSQCVPYITRCLGIWCAAFPVSWQ